MQTYRFAKVREDLKNLCGLAQLTKLLRIMQLTAIILLVACLQVAARSSGQTVTLSVNDVPVRTVFREIEKQTGLDILIDASLLKKTGNISLNVKDMPVEEVMNICLGKGGFEFSIESDAIVVKEKVEYKIPSVFEKAPPPITGIVRGPDGQPLAGVSVIIKGTRNGSYDRQKWKVFHRWTLRERTSNKFSWLQDVGSRNRQSRN